MNEVKKKSKNGLLFITFLTSFFLGSILTFLLLGSYFTKDISSGTKNFFTSYTRSGLDLERFWEVYDTVKKNYYGIDGIKDQEILDGMIRGYINALGDKHSEFMDLKEKKQFDEMLSGDFEGIGAVVGKHELGVIVERVISASPAKKSDVRAGDIIIKVGGVSIEGETVYDAVSKIKGPAGTQVTLTLLRIGEKDLVEKVIQRDKIKIPSVESKVFTGTTLGYIAVNIFGDETSSDFRRAVEDMKKQKTSGLIIDLRDNGGGYLQSAVEMLSQLIENNTLLVETRFRNALENQKYYSINDGDIYTGKIVVLVNENSASASEITAGALRETNKAILVGQKTYGKGSVQEPFDLTGGDLLKLTIAQWYTPQGHMIDKQGIVPDIEVKFEEEDYKKLYDRQLEEAKKVLQEFIKTKALQLSIDAFKKK